MLHILVINVNTELQEKVYLKDIKDQYMRMSSNLVIYVNTMLQKKAITKHIKCQYMRASSTLLYQSEFIATTKSNLKAYTMLVHESNKFPLIGWGFWMLLEWGGLNQPATSRSP